jgi:gamma-glutamylcyclotransferase (GGCT)/AIG2-like uncharacterized protein YtfP
VLVFVYGTLVEPDRVDSILDEWQYVGDAVLEGLHRVEGTYPTLAPGGRAAGRLLRTDELDRLDAYEGVESGSYVRVSVPRNDGGTPIAVYVGDPDRLGAAADWPGDGPFGSRVRAYVEDGEVSIHPVSDRQG